MIEESKKKNQKLTISSEVLQGLFENGKSALSEQFLRWKLWKKWTDFVGPTIGSISEPVGYKNGTLYVWVKNASWMQQLIFMIEPMKENINKKLEIKYVRSIHLTMDRRSVPGGEDEKEQLQSAIDKISKKEDLK
jgi:predicted nucleic acid-binding Zn ribbon protein